jgi:hypothetical protein
MEIAWVKIRNPHLQIVRWLVLVQVISSAKENIMLLMGMRRANGFGVFLDA